MISTKMVAIATKSSKPKGGIRKKQLFLRRYNAAVPLPKLRHDCVFVLFQ